MSKLRLTGGEPLLRRDIVDIVREAQLHPGPSTTFALTTNGTLLADRAKDLKAAGAAACGTVSVDSLDEKSPSRR
ncbi:MAG: radical SAM protein [Candidatus Rariloculaceae bacterium]